MRYYCVQCGLMVEYVLQYACELHIHLLKSDKHVLTEL